MSRLYCYLIATLPELALFSPPPLKVAEFDALCADEIGEARLEKLRSFDWTVEPGTDGSGLPELYAACARFEEYLRNRIARRRAEKNGVTFELPDPPVYYSMFDHLWPQLSAMHDPAEREKMLDELRWEFLDDQSCGHDLDLEYLCIYRLRLIIVNKYRSRASAPGQKRFDMALEMLSPLKKTSEEE